MLEMNYNLKEGILTTSAEQLFEEPFKIQNMLTELNQLTTKKLKRIKHRKHKKTSHTYKNNHINY